MQTMMMRRTERMWNGDHRAIQPESESGDNIDIEERIDAEALALMRRRLEDRRGVLQRTTSRSSVCIYRVPPSLRGVRADAIVPEIVSIGPYHRGRNGLLEFENYKWSFLDYVLSFTMRNGSDLHRIMKSMADLEGSTRRCYSEPTPISSADFVEMMILDSCFILGFMLHVYGSEEDDPILTMPWSIPIVTRDLLKLENQIPFFILEMVYDLMKTSNGDSLVLLALKFFNLALPRSQQILKRLSITAEPKHLLDLVHSSYLPSVINQPMNYTPYSDQSIQCVRLLRKSGIKIRPVKADSFLEINFKKATLQIPPIAINDYTTILFINCVALEQCSQHIRTHFSTNIAFMSCLINCTRDVTFLSGDGIITSFSQDDQYIARLFHRLGENTAINTRDCYLSMQFREVEAYFSSNWATLRRTYFSSPWSFISVFSAFILLVLTAIQTVMAIVGYTKHNI